jgi:transcriptional regulator with XRE-family HTH domain
MAMPAVTEAEIALFADLRPVGRPPRPPDADPALAAFRALIKAHRDARRWSQERLAAEAEMDHSLVSRIESGQRNPTREALGKLATGLRLDRERTEALLLAAGYLPGTIDAGDLRAAVALLREVTPAELAAARALIDAARRV